VDVRSQGHAFRFATSHLDSNSGATQQAQANEFLAGPGDTPLPLVWVGDFNSDADGTPITGVPPATATYGSIIAAGFEDTWATKHPSDPGLTCCQDSDLLNSTSGLTERIDLVLTRGAISAEEASMVGDDPADRLPSGLWPSDHAGVVVSLELEDD
jgi:endonuclease/exonuclease/phosphatase family metal-dependent hydrolase